MDKNQFLKGITYLAIAYNKELTDEQVSVWYDFFKEEDYESFRQGVKRIIPKKQFMPSIAELKQEIALVKNPTLNLKPDEEWEKVRFAIRRYGMYRGDEAMNSFNPTTARVIRMLGGWETICQSTDGDWLRRNFIESFSTKLENYEEVSLLGEPQMTLIELTRMAQLKEAEMLESERLLATEEMLQIENK